MLGLNIINTFSTQLISERVDIWALGTLLYQLMFRKTPFNGASNLEILNGKCEIPDHSPYSEDLHNLIRRCSVPGPCVL